LIYSLLVIDNAAVGLNGTGASILSGEGFTAMSYLSLLMAIEGLVWQKPDLIILGEGLPMDSFEVCCRLRRMLDVPILIMGSIPRDNGWSRAVKSGADCYLEKPITFSELAARVKAILRRCEWNLEQG